MGITKKNGINPDVLQMSNVFKALGHPARLEILNFIKLNPKSSCMLIVEHIPLSQSTISKHISELKAASVIVGKLEKNIVLYELNLQIFNDTNHFLDKFISEITIIENPDLSIDKKIEGNTSFENKLSETKIKKEQKPNSDLKKHNHTFNHLKSK